jgi:Ca2+/H+ antiporter, TMEM165/GDT1 family
LDALLVSAGIVAVVEIGDKTQLLALLLATQLRAPIPIVAGIVAATLANHAFAGATGTGIVSHVGPDVMRRIPGISFLAMAAWTLVPDGAPAV